MAGLLLSERPFTASALHLLTSWVAPLGESEQVRKAYWASQEQQSRNNWAKWMLSWRRFVFSTDWWAQNGTILDSSQNEVPLEVLSFQTSNAVCPWLRLSFKISLLDGHTQRAHWALSEKPFSIIITCGRTYTYTSPLELLTNKHLFFFFLLYRGEDPLIFGMKIIKQGKQFVQSLQTFSYIFFLLTSLLSTTSLYAVVHLQASTGSHAQLPGYRSQQPQ